MLFSLAVIAVIAVLNTSCTRTDSITDELHEVNTTTLAEKLANNPNFKASVTLNQQIGNDLQKFIKDNEIDITKDIIDFDVFINTYTDTAHKFARYKTNILSDLPELTSLKEQAFNEVITLAHDLLDKNKLAVRNCSHTYSICAYNAYYKYYYGYSDYNSYISEYYTCIQSYYRCI